MWGGGRGTNYVGLRSTNNPNYVREANVRPVKNGLKAPLNARSATGPRPPLVSLAQSVDRWCYLSLRVGYTGMAV